MEKKEQGWQLRILCRSLASPLATVKTAELESFLNAYTKVEPVDEFVVGYPVQMNNEPSESVKYVEPFVKRLKMLYPGKPVILYDERFTSRMAFRAMVDGGVKKKERRDKGMVDRISASLILRSFLERRSFLKEKEI